MLFYQTVDTPTLELLKRLLEVTIFKNMRLAGGTSLALQLGHRKSIDLDLFGTIQADEIEFSEALTVFEKVTWPPKSPEGGLLKRIIL